MKRKAFTLVLFGLVILLASTSRTSAEQLRITKVYSSDYVLKILIVDPGGQIGMTHPLAYIDGVNLYDVRVARFQEQNAIPQSILFLVDMKQNNANVEQNRGQEIIRLFMENPNLNHGEESHFFVMPFGDKPMVPRDAKTHQDDLIPCENSSNYYTAIRMGLKLMNSRRDDSRYDEEQLMVLITDGVLPLNHLEDKEMIKTLLRRVDIPMVAIVANDRNGMVEKEHFDEVAEIVGAVNGLVYNVRNYQGANGNRQIVDAITETLYKGSVRRYGTYSDPVCSELG